MFWAFLITLVCVGVPVGGGIALAGWRMLLKSRPAELDPIRVLATRYAAGEIDEADYIRRLEVLTSAPERALPA
jgi:uncharacterized membrane protein